MVLATLILSNISINAVTPKPWITIEIRSSFVIPSLGDISVLPTTNILDGILYTLNTLPTSTNRMASVVLSSYIRLIEGMAVSMVLTQ